MAVVGSAEIIVRAITNQVKKDIEKAFKDARPAIKQAGKDAGKDFAKSFNEQFGKKLDLEHALTDEAKKAGKTASRDLAGELAQGGAEGGRRAGQALENQLGNAGGRGGRKAGNNFLSAFGSDLSSGISRLMNISSVFDILGPAIANIAAALSSVVSGLFAVASAASYAAGALAVLPGLLGAIFQLGGVLRLGFGGIKQAVTAGVKLQNVTGGATKAAKAHASAQKAQTAASNKLAAAEQHLKDVQDELRKAQEASKKANQELQDTSGNAAEAQDLLAQAIRKRNEALNDPNATGQQGADAQKSVDDAKAALDAINKKRQDDAKAAQQAAAAQEAALLKERKAQEAVNKARKASQTAGKIPSGGGALSPAIKAANLYQQALNKLSPAAQKFVKQLLSMQDRVRGLKFAIQDQLFPPLTKALKLLDNDRLWKMLNKNLGDTGHIAGIAGLQFTKAFLVKSNQTLFQKWLKNNNDILDTMITKTKDGETPIQGLLSLFLKLGNAIQPVTKRFAEWIAGLVTGADKAAKIGKLETFFQKAGDRAALLGKILGNLGKALIILAGGADKSGTSLLTSFEQATAKLDEFLQKAKDTGKLDKYFTGVESNFRSIATLAEGVGKLFISLGDNPGVKAMADALNAATPEFQHLADTLSSAGVGKAVGNLGKNIADLLNSLTQSGQTEIFLNTLSNIVKVINVVAIAFNKIPFAGVILGFFGIARALNFSAKILGFSKSFGILKKAVIGTPFKNITSDIGAFIKKSSGVSRVSQAFKDLGKKIAGSKIGQAFKKIFAEREDSGAKKKGKQTGDDFTQGLELGIKENQEAVLSAINQLMDKVLTDFNAAVDLMPEIGHDIALGLANGIKSHEALVVTAAADLSEAFIDAVKAKLGIHSPSIVMDGLGVNSAEGFINGVRSEGAAAFKAGETLAAEAAAGARSVPIAPTAIAEAPKAAVSNAVAPAISPGISGVSKTVDETAKKTTKLGSAASKLGGIFKGLGSGLLGLVGGPIGLLITAIPLIISGLTLLYQKSPGFRKFVDTIVKAIKPLVDAIGKWLLGVLNDFFNWVNKNMPAIQKFIGSAVNEISKIFQKLAPIIGDVIGFIVDHWKVFSVAIGALLLGPLGIAIALIVSHFDTFKKIVKVSITVAVATFKVLKTVITGVVIPAFKLIWDTAKTVFDAVKTIITFWWNNVVSKYFNLVKNIVLHVYVPIFKMIWTIAKTVFDAVKNIIAFWWSNVISKYFNLVKNIITNVVIPVFNRIQSVAASVFSKVGSIIGTFRDTFSHIGDVIGNVATGIGNAFGKIRDAAAAPIRYVINTVWNNGVVALADKIPGVNASGWKVNVGFAKGGYTGPGGTYDVAGLVHRDEFVIRKSSRRVLEQLYPGLLDHMNKTGKLPNGHASGGRVRGKYSGAVPASARSLPGYFKGGISIPNPVNIIKNAGSGLLNLGGKAIKWTGNIIKGGISWSKDMVVGAVDKIKEIVSWITNLPGNIAANMNGTEWGRIFSGIPKAAVNKAVDQINAWVPDIVPGIPLGQPFPGVQFRAGGGRVQAGKPYVVGEREAELFIPDQSGTIIPSLDKLKSNGNIDAVVRGMQRILSTAEGAGIGNGRGGNANSRTKTAGLTVNIHNPEPERASQSVAKTIRNKAVNSGWSV